MKKKETVLWIDHPLSPDERRNFAKDHPGMRLSLRLRYPWLSYVPLAISVIALIISIIADTR